MQKSAYARWFAVLLKLPKLMVPLAKLAKLSKILTTMGTALISIIAYAIAMKSWLFGFGFVYLLFIHELGHVWAAKRQGVAASLPVFIPFIGAAIFIKKFDSLRSEAVVAVAGPLLGLTALLPVIVIYVLEPSKVWGGLIFLGVLLNTFNLLPVRPFDGGRMTSICGRWFKVLGLSCLALLSIVIHQPVMLYVWVLVLSDIAFPLWWRTISGVTLTVLMGALMILGYSHQPWFIDAMDVTFAAMVCLTYYWGELAVSEGKEDPFLETFSDEHLVSNRERWLWGSAWAAMVLFGTAALWGTAGL